MPVERLRLRPWLEQQIDNNSIAGLQWINREKKIFRVAWKHASRQGWKIETDASLFRAWAIHTGKFRTGKDQPIPKTWKANFRCALNALPDIEEIRGDGKTKGLDAYKVYRMLPKDIKPKAKKNATRSSKVQKKVHRFKDYKPREKITTDQNEMLNSSYLSPVSSPMSIPMMSPMTSPVCSPFSSPFNSPQYSNCSPVVTPTSPMGQSWSQQWSPADPLRDHDYLAASSLTYKQYRVLKDIGVNTFGDIKQEPIDFVSTGTSPIFDLQIDECRDFPDLSRVVKEEVLVAEDGSVPTDQEIINLVDELSNSSESFYGNDSDRGFSATSPTYSSSSGLSDNIPETPVSPLSPFMSRPTSFPFPIKTENGFNSNNMGMQCTLTMSPDCTRDLLKRIGLSMHQGGTVVN